MVVGLGIDVLEIARMGDVVHRHGKHFLARILTAAELAAAPQSDRAKATYYAGRWAAKEAVSKALGTGIGASCGWLDMEIMPDALGRPRLTLTGAAAETARRIGAESWHLSISHESAIAAGCAIAEKLSK
ncbi:MAG: holo-ACP synthase [Victivallales bacterium]|jgi:holo-[acyl-carrier protein] synthase|nr:holo-ACP synthase [Victivallales bacterium]MBT7166907.1 holo-ACP synthase [Victivallales bacterium]